MFWPTASALGLLEAESKNFIFVLQGHCDLHVKRCRRMQPDVTRFWNVRMCDLDGFKQCKLGLRYVNFAPVQTFMVDVLQGWDNDESGKTCRNRNKKAKLATLVGHTSGRQFTKQLQLQQASTSEHFVGKTSAMRTKPNIVACSVRKNHLAKVEAVGSAEIRRDCTEALQSTQALRRFLWAKTWAWTWQDVQTNGFANISTSNDGNIHRGTVCTPIPLSFNGRLLSRIHTGWTPCNYHLSNL